MQLLLPPSETKRPGGGSVFVPGLLAHDAALGSTRIRVRDALVALSGDTDAAAKALKLGVKNRDELLRNLELGESGVMPSIERYTGVLYDALDVDSLPARSRDWLAGSVSIQSALFGLIGAADEIPAYRLSASSRVPELGAPLKRVWQEAHEAVDWQSLGWILDLRSKDYAALAPVPEGSGSWLNVAQESVDGEIRALNHFNKAAKGDLVRRLALSRPQIRSREEFMLWAISEGLNVYYAADSGELTLVTALGAPRTSATR